jgi:hypothetical protein
MADLKPMEMGEVLDGAFTLYRRHFGLFLKLSVAVMWLPVALAVYLRLRFMGSGPEQMVGIMQDHLLVGILVVLLVAVAYTLASLLLTAGSIHIISASYLGREPTLGEALSLGATRILPLFLVAVGKALLIFMIAVAGALVIGVLAALGKVAGTAVTVLLTLAAGCTLTWFVIYVACGYGLTTPVIVLEELSSSFDAFGRSWELTRNFKLKLLGLGIIAYLIANLVPSAFVGGIGGYAALSYPALQPAVVVVSALLPIVLAPILPCVFTLLYYDLRVRREGFDLQLLGQQLGII